MYAIPGARVGSRLGLYKNALYSGRQHTVLDTNYMRNALLLRPMREVRATLTCFY